MKKVMLTMFAVLSTLVATTTQARMMQKHKGMPCLACHQKGFTPPKTETCLACHNSDEIVKATERFNFEKRFRNPATGRTKKTFAPINPHDNFHFGREESCLSCHKEHKESTLLCQNCHDTGPWNMKAPR